MDDDVAALMHESHCGQLLAMWASGLEVAKHEQFGKKVLPVSIITQEQPLANLCAYAFLHVYLHVYGWLAAWMDGWMDRWNDGQIVGHMV